MGRPSENRYSPDVVSLPGETLAELLAERGLSQAELAERMGRPKKTVNEIIKGKTPITPETALQLERVLSVRASFWNNLESNYRAHVARQEEEARLEEFADWPKLFPLAQMAKWHWIDRHRDSVQQVRELLAFFGVVSPAQWKDVYAAPQASFRQSSAFEIDAAAVAAWLRQGEIEAEQLRTAGYRRSTFRRALREVRELTLEPDPEVFMPQLTQLCARSGVAVVFVPEPKGCRASGAARWLTPSKALIQLSLRGKSDDRLWFTFFHEAAHILFHGKRLVFLDEGGPGSGSGKRAAKIMAEEEDDANRFAATLLVPQEPYQKFVGERSRFSKVTIRMFAQSIGVGPGIVVGRLQHDGLLPYSHCNDLKTRYRFVEDAA